MQLKKLEIKNFRNFDNCTIDLTNKNLIFGMNDVGKSNMLYALRMLFDSRIRNIPIETTDFHKHNIDDPIEISCFVDIADDKNEYSQLLIARVENACTSDSELFQIKLTSDYNNGDSNTYLEWGTVTEPLLEIPNKGIKSLLDSIFHCIFIPSQNNTSSSFKDFKKELLDSHEYIDEDNQFSKEIETANHTINENVAKLSSVQSMQTNINNKLDIFDKKYKVKILPSHTFGDLHNKLDLYMHDITDVEGAKLYPTSGDGRIRKVMYAIISYLLKEGKNAQGKIPILLIEEPENHLFLSAQVELSKSIFNEKFNPYLFLTTHSPQLFFRISDEANLIRLYHEEDNIQAKSQFAIVPDKYQAYKNILLENLAQCLFVDKVLLVEGQSEKLLFEWVLDSLNKERQSILVQSILGINFDKYVEILTGLGIDVLIKTDNDIKKNSNQTYSAIGYNRCVKLMNIKYLDLYEKQDSLKLEYDEFRQHIVDTKSDDIKSFRENGIFLSKKDLENDLIQALDLSKESGIELIEWLQEAKWQNMWYFITLNEEEIPKNIYTELNLIENMAQAIYEHENFTCLKELVNDV